MSIADGPGKATAIAHPNIALVKYWGKRDEARILPFQSSLSLTLAPLEVRTTVAWEDSNPSVTLHGKPARPEEERRVRLLLEQVLQHSGRTQALAQTAAHQARVTSEGNFPMAAGLASSAAAFAALAIAARSALGFPRDVLTESKMARLGSGSACRSVQGGFCVWRRGSREDGEDSYAEQLVPASYWNGLRMLVAVLSGEEKRVKSRDGMRETVKTSPYYPAWVESSERDIALAEALIRERNLPALGALAERNAWRMHASALAADPPLCYLRPQTLGLVLALEQARADGVPVWFTLDAGPNPVLLCDAQHVSAVEALARENGAQDVVCCVPGGDARLTDAHLG